MSASERQQQPGTPRRRLGALEAAAAMAVIVLCLAALASMTGLLPASMQMTVRQSDAPAASAVAIEPDTQAGVTAAAPAVAMPQNSVGPVSATDAAVALDTAATATAANAVAAVAAINEADRRPGSIALAQTTRMASVAPQRRHRHDHASREGTRDRAGHAPGKTGKTREQVTAELMQSKRDGTYPAQSEIYR